MAKITLQNENSCKTRLTLEDCETGDIVLLNQKIYIIIDGDSYSTTFKLADLKTGEEIEFHYDTICSRYQKSLYFDMLYFQDYKSID